MVCLGLCSFVCSHQATYLGSFQLLLESSAMLTGSGIGRPMRAAGSTELSLHSGVVVCNNTYDISCRTLSTALSTFLRPIRVCRGRRVWIPSVFR